MQRILYHKARVVALSLAAITALSTASLPVSALVTDPAGDYDNFAKALQYSLYFYDGNMCGDEVAENNRYTWRSDCHTYDNSVPLQPMGEDYIGTNLSQDFIETYYDILNTGETDGTVDVAGGFHDAGDHVKFGLPEAYAGTTVSWGYYEFREAYEETEQADHVETIIRYFCDYFMKCTFRDANGDVVAFCYQVGEGGIDHAYWQLPEIDTMARPAWFATADNPTTCNVANTAACLAINHLIFAESDPDYAAQCLDYAIALYDFATQNDKAIADTSEGPAAFYTSSKWEDDYCFASCWLYMITKEQQYLDNALPIVDFYAPPTYVYCWNDMWNGVMLLLGMISEDYVSDTTYSDAENPNGLCDLAMDYIAATNKSPYEEIDFWACAAKAINTYMTGGVGTITPQGYFWLNTWGSARYNTAAQFCALVYDKYNDGKDLYNTSNPDYTFSEWAKGQMEYLLGNNETTFLEGDGGTGSRCYLVGYDESSAKYPHHRAASGLTKCEDTDQQLHVLFGALCGGPDAEDCHNDVTADWIYNEVTIDYNAAVPGAAAGLYLMYKDQYPQSITPDFPPKDDGGRASASSGDGAGSNETWIEAQATDIIQTDGYKVEEVTLYVRTNSATPMTDVSVRYYFTRGNVTLENMTVSELYDQCSAETDMDGVLSGPFVYDEAKDIYYVEISWPGYAIANSGKKYQFSIGTYYYQDSWDPTDDWSYQDLNIVESNWDNNCVRTDYICVYNEGTLVGGIEPDGTTVTQPAETTTTPDTGDKLYGDVNCDGYVLIDDVILSNRYVAEDTAITITMQGITNGDCDDNGALTSDDSVLILRLIAGLITVEELGG